MLNIFFSCIDFITNSINKKKYEVNLLCKKNKSSKFVFIDPIYIFDYCYVFKISVYY